MELPPGPAPSLTIGGPEWVRWVGWTWLSIIASLALATALSFGPEYTMTGMWDCNTLGYAFPDVLIDIAQPLAVVMYGKKGPSAF